MQLISVYNWQCPAYNMVSALVFDSGFGPAVLPRQYQSSDVVSSHEQS